MLKIAAGVFLLIAVGLLVYAQIAWREEMKEWPRPEDHDPKDDDNYCSDMDQLWTRRRK
jgi:hypothetical protein